MIQRRIRTVKDVAEWRLCTGCGACQYACPNRAVSLINIPADGIRPKVDSELCESCGECLDICPGYSIDSGSVLRRFSNRASSKREFDRALEIWEGYATDPEIRYRGSSGGVLSALALYSLEQEGVGFVIHAGMDEDRPWLNKTYSSRNRTDILARAGSRYSPASPCDGLDTIEKSEKSCVFVGKPCDVSAMSSLCRQRPELDRKVALLLTHFCAGTPSTQGTLDLLNSMTISPEEIGSLRYRGEGWPGKFCVCLKDCAEQKSMSYIDTWNELYKYVPLRCRLCCDGFGRLSDISCGDAWQDFGEDGDTGRSLVLVRTERGRDVIRGAVDAGYVTLERIGGKAVLNAQANLLMKRRHLFGRLLAMRLLLIPTPRFAGFDLFQAWEALPLREKWYSVSGTLKRLVQRHLWRRQKFGLTVP